MAPILTKHRQRFCAVDPPFGLNTGVSVGDVCRRMKGMAGILQQPHVSFRLEQLRYSIAKM